MIDIPHLPRGIVGTIVPAQFHNSNSESLKEVKASYELGRRMAISS